MSLDEDRPEPVIMTKRQAVEPPNANASHLQVATSVRLFRQKSGLSQRQLALRMQVPRTYVSKIENEKALPTLASLKRLADALKVSVADLLRGSSRTLEEEINDLMHDDFIAAIMPYWKRLDAMQRSNLLAQVRDLNVRPRRSA